MEARSSGRIGLWWRGRFGRALLLEFVLVYALFLLYKFVRFLAKGQVDAAFENADLVWDLESSLFLASEAKLQALVIASTAFVRSLNTYYVWMHFPTAGLFLAWIYAFRAPAYAHMRRLFILTTFTALVVHVVFPLAPPRMVPGLGFVDTMAVYGPTTYGDTYLAHTANQFAAMPSVHFSWALLVCYGVLRHARSRARWLVLGHPGATLAVIILTANHFWLDAVAGGLIVAAALAVEPRVERISAWVRGQPSRSPAAVSLDAKPEP